MESNVKLIEVKNKVDVRKSYHPYSAFTMDDVCNEVCRGGLTNGAAFTIVMHHFMCYSEGSTPPKPWALGEIITGGVSMSVTQFECNSDEYLLPKYPSNSKITVYEDLDVGQGVLVLYSEAKGAEICRVITSPARNVCRSCAAGISPFNKYES